MTPAVPKLADEGTTNHMMIPVQGDWLVKTLEVNSGEPDRLTELGQA